MVNTVRGFVATSEGWRPFVWGIFLVQVSFPYFHRDGLGQAEFLLQDVIEEGNASVCGFCVSKVFPC